MTPPSGTPKWNIKAIYHHQHKIVLMWQRKTNDAKWTLATNKKKSKNYFNNIQQPQTCSKIHIIMNQERLQKQNKNKYAPCVFVAIIFNGLTSLKRSNSLAQRGIVVCITLHLQQIGNAIRPQYICCNSCAATSTSQRTWSVLWVVGDVIRWW